MNYWKIAFFVLGGAFIIILCFILFNPKPLENNDKVFYKTDTLIKILPQKVIEIKNAKPKIIYRHDTIIQTPPFFAIVDTIIEKDTLRAEFTFPENNFSLNYHSQSDSILTITNIVTKTETNWLERAAFLFGGIIFGIIISK